MMTYENFPLDYIFKDPEHLKQAFTHKSFHNENASQSNGHNEKLEFLGDSVLDLSLSSLLMLRYPELNEGALSKIRASLVNEDSLADIANQIKLDQYILLGRGESKMKGAQKPRLLASCVEAIIGALFVDGGFTVADKWVGELFAEALASLDLTTFYVNDYKTSLQEIVQKKFKMTPIYNLTDEKGPDHEKVFFSEVLVENELSCTGSGKTKKNSEQMAAKKALEKFI